MGGARGGLRRGHRVRRRDGRAEVVVTTLATLISVAFVACVFLAGLSLGVVLERLRASGWRG